MSTNITGMCGECSQCLGHTGLAPAHDVCAFPVYTAHAPGCFSGELSKVGPGLRVLPRSKSSSSGSWVLPKGTDVVGLVFFPFQIPSSPGDQVLGERTLPRLGGASYHLPRPSHSVFWVRSGSTTSGVPCVSSGELISGRDPPGRCQPSRIPGSLG